MATLSISYYDLGYTTGEMAVQDPHRRGQDVYHHCPLSTAPTVTKKYNAANCEALGITVPDGYEAIALRNTVSTEKRRKKGLPFSAAFCYTMTDYSLF